MQNVARNGKCHEGDMELGVSGHWAGGVCGEAGWKQRNGTAATFVDAGRWGEPKEPVLPLGLHVVLCFPPQAALSPLWARQEKLESKHEYEFWVDSQGVFETPWGIQLARKRCWLDFTSQGWVGGRGVAGPTKKTPQIWLGWNSIKPPKTPRNTIFWRPFSFFNFF